MSPASSHGPTMTPSTDADRGHDPCLQIQVDLSAMVDGELDAAGVRRVMVHSDLCAHCRQFLEGIRAHARLHKKLAALAPATAAADAPSVVDKLRLQLTANRTKLSRVLYELGRGFVLMGLSAEFSREVAREPVPVPDMAMRARNLLDEVSRGDAGMPQEAASAEWVAARQLFDGQLRSPEENLAKGQRLLSECLALEPECHEARIYLGLVHYVRGQRSSARRQFADVLAHSQDRRIRGFALLNLGNIHLDEGDAEGAVQLLLQLVESGVIPEQPSLSTAYFNLGLAFGLSGRFDQCVSWFQRMARELPHKHTWMARELGRRSHFLHLIRNHPDAKVVSEAFPSWFLARPAS
jgi:tetratricopeptide (TPR) repeat protein